jgi:hypothetical protein
MAVEEAMPTTAIQSTQTSRSSMTRRPQFVSPVGVDMDRDPRVEPREIGKEVTYDSYARTRADHPIMSFRVYEPGITDQDNRDVANQVKVVAYYRYADKNGKFSKGKFQKVALTPEYRQGPYGNDNQYSLSLRELDPMRTSGDAQRLGGKVKMQVFFTVNGMQPKETRPGNGFIVNYLNPNYAASTADVFE